MIYLIIVLICAIAIVKIVNSGKEDSKINPKITKKNTEDISLTDYVYIIELFEPINFFDISTPLLNPVEMPAGIYELVCIPSLSNTDTFWWSIPEQEIGIYPFALKNLIETKKARWIKKPKTNN